MKNFEFLIIVTLSITFKQQNMNQSKWHQSLETLDMKYFLYTRVLHE